MSTFGERLKTIRLSKGMSQEELASLLGTSKQVISRYETDQRVPKLTVAALYAVKLEVPVNLLIDDNEKESVIIYDDGLSAGARKLDEELKKHGVDSQTLSEDDIRMIAALLKAKYNN